jgi:hypothetical protein
MHAAEAKSRATRQPAVQGLRKRSQMEQFGVEAVQDLESGEEAVTSADVIQRVSTGRRAIPVRGGEPPTL